MGKPLPKLLLPILFLSTTCFAQFPLSFGLKGGVPLTENFRDTETIDTYFSTNTDYVLGPMVELRLPFHLAVEADALFRPLQAIESVETGRNIFASSNVDSHSWEFPIVAKYRFNLPIVKPFVTPYIAAGPSFRANSIPFTRLSDHGVAVGLGLDFHFLLLHVAPEVRYTYWGSASGALPLPSPYLEANQRQVEFLVGLTL
jgi:hypothetical protein